ncbi:MAG: hypothetical protein V2I24_01340 [Halieaceae bacterium]|nr:hypothetical protein [Halieaceae bacterium]
MTTTMGKLIRATEALLAAFVMATTGACAAQDQKGASDPEPEPYVQPDTAKLPDLVALRTCVNPKGSCIRINIAFVRDESTGRMCPGYVGAPATYLIDGNVDIEYLQWQAWEQVNGAWRRYANDYRVVFSPFQGHVVRSDPKTGLAESPEILDWFGSYFQDNEREFPFDFKYTVIAKECPDKPLDPRVRVHR